MRSAVAIVALLLACGAPLSAQLTMGTVSEGTTNNGTSITVTPAITGSDRLLIACPGWVDGGAQSVTAVTHNGVAMSLVALADDAFAYRQAMYYLVAPATTGDTVATWSGGVQGHLVVVPWTGANQSTPLGTAALDSGTSSAPSVTVTSAAGETVLDCVRMNTDYVEGSGQTLIADTETTGWAKASTEAGAASVVMDWTGSNGRWSSVGVSVKPAGGGGGSGPPIGTFNLLGVGR
jgi:hypothetical protein